MPKIKIRETVKDVKVIDKAAVAGERMRNAFVRTKDQTQNLMDDGQTSPSEYAEDKIRYALEDTSREVGHEVKRGADRTVDRAKEARRQYKESKRTADHTKDGVKRTSDTVRQAERGSARVRKAQSQTIKSTSRSAKTIKQTAKSTGQATAKTAKGTIKTAEKGVKTAQQTSKAAIKTAEATAKASKAAAQASAKAAKAEPANLLKKIESMQEELKAAHSENEKLKAKLANASLGDVMNNVQEINGVKVLAAKVPEMDMNGIRNLGDSLKEKLGEGVLLLASAFDGKVNLIAMATDGAMAKGAHAGNLIKEVAACVGGGGGGRPNMAQAGGKNPAGIDDAIAKAAEVLKGQIK